MCFFIETLFSVVFWRWILSFRHRDRRSIWSPIDVFTSGRRPKSSFRENTKSWEDRFRLGRNFVEKAGEHSSPLRGEVAGICRGRRLQRCVERKKFPKLESCYFCDEGGGYTGSSERRAGALWMKKAAFAESGISGRFRQPLVRRFFWRQTRRRVADGFH